MNIKGRIENLESVIKPKEDDIYNMSLPEMKIEYSKNLFADKKPFPDGYMPQSEEEYIQRFTALSCEEIIKFIEYQNAKYET